MKKSFFETAIFAMATAALIFAGCNSDSGGGDDYPEITNVTISGIPESAVSEPVELNLLASTHKISNMLFSLYFFQKDAVGGSKTAATYDLFFVDSYNNVISDKQRIIADKTSDDGQDRQFRCNFSLKQNKYDKNESYYLLIVDENGNEKDKIEYEIDIAFAFEDFGF